MGKGHGVGLTGGLIYSSTHLPIYFSTLFSFYLSVVLYFP
jgi:hypothetical protein